MKNDPETPCVAYGRRWRPAMIELGEILRLAIEALPRRAENGTDDEGTIWQVGAENAFYEALLRSSPEAAPTTASRSGRSTSNSVSVRRAASASRKASA
jgi:hypothetical protein